jgi:hypothetical protein
MWKAKDGPSCYSNMSLAVQSFKSWRDDELEAGSNSPSHGRGGRAGAATPKLLWQQEFSA